MQQLSDQIQNEDASACVVCGQKLPPTLPRISCQAQTFLQPAMPFNGRGRLRRYCSNACRQRAKRLRAGNRGTARKHRESSRKNGSILKLPLIRPPGKKPRGYDDWTLDEKQHYGPGNRRVQWELQKRVIGGMTVVQVSSDIGLPQTVVQKYVEKNQPFKQRIVKARAWAAEKPVFSLLLSLGATRDSANEGGSPQKPTE